MSRIARSRMGRAVRAAPSFSLGFTKGVLDPRLTFTRASGATYIDSTGVMQTAASNAPRFDYDPVTLAIRGLLIEEARTNLSTNSRQFVTGASVGMVQNLPGADGAALTAYTMTESATTAQQFAATTPNPSFTSGTTYTLTALVKPGTANKCQLTGSGTCFGATQCVNFSLSGAGSVLQSLGGAVGAIKPGPNGFYVCSITVAAIATGTGTAVAVAFITSDTDARLPSITGTSRTLILDHHQAEAGAFPTSIIPTSGAAATRAAETCVNGNTVSMLPWLSPKEGTTWVEYVSFANAGVSTRAFTIRNSPGTNALNCANSSGGALVNQKTANSAVSSCTTRAAYTPNTLFRAASSYDSAIMYGASNGAVNGAGSTTTAPFSGGDLPGILDIGSQGSASQLNGWIRGFQYFPVALPLRELQRLTATSAQPAPTRINPDFSLHFLDGVLDSRITFTRASGGTRIDSAGVLVTETTNVPRFDYDPITLACKGLLIEEARTNVVSSSSNSSTFSKVDVTTVQNVTGVDGVANSASTCTEGTAGSATCAPGSITAVAAGAQITGTVVLKRGNTDWARIILSDNSLVDGGNFWVNLATGQNGIFSARGAGTLLNISIKPMGGGWYACSPTVKPNASYTIPQVVVVSAAGDGNGARVNGATYLLHHFQVEAGAFPTSIIATTGAAATRAADLASVTAIDTAGWFNQNQGALVMDCTTAFDTTTTRRLCGVRSASGNDAFHLLRNIAHAAGVRTAIAGAGDFNPSTAYAIPANVPVKVVGTYSHGASPSKSVAAVGGSVSAVSTAITSTPYTVLDLGSSVGSQIICGYLRHFDYYKQTLPADFITELSR